MDVSNRIPTERAFGVSMGVVCAAAAGLAWRRGHDATAATLAVTASILAAAGLLAPAWLRAPNRAWWRFAQVLGWINTRVILVLFFFVVVTPIGAVMRLLGRNPLRIARTDTNWSPYSARRGDHRHYEHMF